MVTLWDKAQHIKINIDKKEVGNFDIGFDEEIPEIFRNRMRNVIVWLENNYNFPITIWVDFEYKNYLISREKSELDIYFIGLISTIIPILLIMTRFRISVCLLKVGKKVHTLKKFSYHFLRQSLIIFVGC